MAQFDFESGLAGAQTGAVGGPWGALAGFVVSGFAGGHKKSATKKLMKRRNKALMKLASPKHLAEVTKELTPLFREQVAGGAGAAATGSINNFVARNGFTGTGIGAALNSGAAAIPELMAFQSALGQAGGVINRQASAYNQQLYPEQTDVAGLVGEAGDAAQLFKQLSARSGGPAGGLTALAPGEYDRMEADSFKNATDEFSQQPFDFGQFNYRR